MRVVRSVGVEIVQRALDLDQGHPVVYEDRLGDSRNLLRIAVPIPMLGSG